MPLTILSDTNVKDILESLTRTDVEALQQSLRKALHDYSTGTQENDACSSQQPERTSHVSPNGLTTLFMPSTSATSIGMKGIFLVPCALSMFLIPSLTSSAPLVVTLTAPSKTDAGSPQADFTPRGALTIMNHTGQPTGFLNAEEVTAFRTALASTLLLCRRARLKILTVFGAGKQAYWHIRLALLLRGHTIKNINIINRKLSNRTKMLLRSFMQVNRATKAHEGWTNTKFAIMSPEYGEYDRLIKEQLRAADAIIMTVPSAEPLFDHLILTSTEGRKKGRLLIAIGSYKPHMIEVPKEMLLQAVRPTHDHRHFHRHAVEGGVIVVDTLTGCLKEAGEVIQAGLSPMQLVEVGELVMLENQSDSLDDSESNSVSDLDIEKINLEKRSLTSSNSSMSSVMRENSTASSGSSRRSGSLSRAFSSKSLGSGKHKRSSSVDSSRTAKDDAMSRWLSTGNVIYKSVGMGLMDLVVGGELVRLGRERGIGTTIQDF
jgi:ornithine cyclodeaminase/alanine dehydrogenase-like protein (mu-crystallin family)